MTECNPQIELFSIGRRRVTVRIDGEHISSNAGVLLAAKIERRLGLCERMSALLVDERDDRHVRHGYEALLRQRVLQIALGYPDANDATQLRFEPALQAALGLVPGDEESILASQPTLSRFEDRSPRELARMARQMIDLWVEQLCRRAPRAITLEFDTTDAVTHGHQQLSMFHKYYDNTIYHPLLVFDGEGFPIVTLLRPGNSYGGRGAVTLLRLIMKRLRRSLPNVRVMLRADAGFATPQMYQTCERLGLSYLIAQNVHERYTELTAPMVALGEELAAACGESVRLYEEFRYRAGTWNRERRVVAKAECSAGASHVRYVVTNIETGTPEEIYGTYSGRGQSENYIKDLKNAMFADRLSCTRFWSNQFRLLLHTLAYIILFELRRELTATELVRAQLDTVRLRLLKIGASIVVTARRIWVRLSSADPNVTTFELLARRLLTPT